MPRGIYDRSKVARKSKTVKSPKIQKVAKSKATRAGKTTGSLTETLSNLNACAEILSKLNTATTINNSLQKAKDGMTLLILEFLGQISTSEAPAVEAPTEAVSKPTKSPVSYPAPQASTGLKLKKDGTPKARPGPKPKAGESQVAEAVPTNGNSDVFNPEHAS